MKFGIHLGSVNAKFWGQVTEEADRLGFESVWVPEHVVVPLDASGSPHHGSEHPPIPSNIPIYDALGVLCFLAARTSRIRLGTNVFNLGLRHPFLTARAATTVDVLSGGRPGSWDRGQLVAQRVDRHGPRLRRARRADRRVHRRLQAVVNRPRPLSITEPTSISVRPRSSPSRSNSRCRSTSEAMVLPRCGGPPPSERDGCPMNHALGDLPPSIERLRKLTEAVGRQMVEVTVPGEIATHDDVEAYTRAGVHRVIVRPWTSFSTPVPAWSSLPPRSGLARRRLRPVVRRLDRERQTPDVAAPPATVRLEGDSSVPPPRASRVRASRRTSSSPTRTAMAATTSATAQVDDLDGPLAPLGQGEQRPPAVVGIGEALGVAEPDQGVDELADRLLGDVHASHQVPGARAGGGQHLEAPGGLLGEVREAGLASAVATGTRKRRTELRSNQTRARGSWAGGGSVGRDAEGTTSG